MCYLATKDPPESSEMEEEKSRHCEQEGDASRVGGQAL